MDGHIFLTGYMGTGKTSVSHRLSVLLDMKELDTDEFIASREGMTVNDIFAVKGEEYFRDLETQLLRELGESGGRTQDLIVSCGGGMVLRDENAALMRGCGKVIWLTATPETILERVGDDDSRPLLRGNKNTAYIADMLKKRNPKYAAAANAVVATDGRSVDDICREICGYIQRHRS